MNITAKYAGRVVQLLKPLEDFERNEIITIAKIEVNTISKGKGLKIFIEDEALTELSIKEAPEDWKYETWLSKYFKILY